MKKIPENGAPILKRTCQRKLHSESPEWLNQAYQHVLENWVEMLGIPRLGYFDIKDSDLDLIVQESSNRHNPIELTDSEIRSLLERRC